MTWFTVEVTLRSVEKDDWSRHLRAVDAVPGTLLIQDVEEPVLSFPVEADSPFKAARFVEGILSIVGLEAVSGEITDMPAADFDLDEEIEGYDDSPSDDARRVHNWMFETPEAPGAQDKRELIH